MRELAPWERNPRTIKDANAKLLAQSVEDFGQVETLAIGPSGELYNGHQRLSVLAGQYGMDYEVDVRRASRALTEKERERLTVYLHRGAAGEWDWSALADWDYTDLTAWGFTADELDGHFGVEDGSEAGAGEDTEPQVDKAQELLEKWGVETGQSWQLGNHTLLVGDGVANCATNPTVIVDPEWQSGNWIDISQFDSALVFFDNNHIGDVFARYGPPRWLFTWDCCTTWYVQNKPLLQAKFCAWYGSGKYIQDGWRYGESSFVSGKHTNGRGAAFDYVPHEDGRMLSDIFKMPIVQAHSDGLNSHSKPLDWMTALIANCTSGDISDPFAGSGTSIVASEKIGRHCDACEVDPAMAAVIIQRCEDFGLRVRRIRGANE